MMDYGTLKALVTKYIHRGDLADQMDAFQELAVEAVMTRATLIVLEKRGTLSFPTTPQPLPADWFRFKAVRFSGRGGIRPLHPMTKPQLDKSIFEDKTTEPVNYAIDAGLDIGGFEDAVIDFTYYAQPTVLVADIDTNALLTKHPSLYLQGMMTAAHHLAQDTESMRVAEGEFEIALEAANNFDKFAALSGGAPQLT